MKRLALLALLSVLVASQAHASPVKDHGRLQARGSSIIGQDGKPVSLAGNSLFWSQWEGAFWNSACVNWLKQDWKSDIIRAAVGVESGGYLDHPDVELARVEAVIDAAIAADLYVIVDWHDHHAEKHVAQATDFFVKIAKKYGRDPHLIYEIFNEPLKVSWPAVIKPYAEKVIAAIRAVDSENLIVVGTPNWSQLVDAAADDPIKDNNVAYTLHFYAGTHKQWLRDKADYALGKGIALFVTEWGACNADGGGALDLASTAEWLEFMRSRQLSHCSWAVSAKKETSAIVVPGSAGTGGWTNEQLTPWGRYARTIIREWATTKATGKQASTGQATGSGAPTMFLAHQ
jgi:endoglucanase